MVGNTFFIDFLQAAKRKDFHKLVDSANSRKFVFLSSVSSCSEFKDLEPISIYVESSIFLCVINRHVLNFYGLSTFS